MLRTALILCLSVCAEVASASAISQVRLPAIGNAVPTSITRGSDGNLWYTVQGRPVIVRVTPSGVSTDFPVTEPPRALAAGTNGDVWYVGMEVGKLSSDGSVTTFPAPYSGSGTDLTLGPDGNIWMVAECSANVYRMTPQGVSRAFPVSNGCPSRLTTGPDNNIWVTLHYGNKIARVTLNGSVTEFATTNINPDDITSGPDGNLYFTNNDGWLGKITTAGTVTLTSIVAAHFGEITLGIDNNLWLTGPSAIPTEILRVTPAGQKTPFLLPEGAKPTGIAAGPDGRLWIADRGLGQIRAMTTAGARTDYPAAVLRGDPTSMALAGDGSVWFTEPAQNKIGRITPAGIITEWAIPEPASGPGDIVLGPDGAMWFTETEGGIIGRATTAGITEFPLPDRAAKPTGITRGVDGNLWFTLAAKDTVVRMTPAGVMTEFRIPRSGVALGKIAAAPDGRLWMTLSYGLARISADGSGYTEFIPSWGTTPAAVTIAGDGSIWFASSGGIGRLDPDAEFSSEISRVSFVAAGSIAAGPDGAMWVPVNGRRGQMVRITLAGLEQVFQIPAVTVGGVTAGPDRGVWLSAPEVGHLVRIQADRPITATPAAICANGFEVDGVVATFTDSDPAGTAAEFTAEAHWSDGTVSPATIAAAGGHFDVSASHTFSSGGDWAVEIHILGLQTARDFGGTEAIVTSTIRRAEITAPARLCATTTTAASVSMNESASSYAWTIGNGTIVEGQGTSSILFTAASVGSVDLAVSATVAGCVVSSTRTVYASACLRGDANGDRSVTTSDAFFLIQHLFAAGPAPGLDGDVNSDGIVTVADLTFLTDYLLGDGPAPQP